MRQFHKKPEHSCPEKVARLWKHIQDDGNQQTKVEPALLHLSIFSIFTIALPSLKSCVREFQRLYKEAIVDLDMKDDLQRSGVINWCRSAKKLYPLFTEADGNCLLHAVSLYLWGMEDTQLYIRRLLYLNIASDPQEKFKKRWLLQQRSVDSAHNFDFGMNTEEYTAGWESVIRATEDVARSENHALSYDTLESIHLFVLANTLKRTIIVLADNQARSVFGQSLQESNICGVYYPVEIPAEECCKTPIILGYNLNHFAPLVFEETAQDDSKTEKGHVIPLVTRELNTLPVRFLLPQEEKECYNYMKKYLTVREVVHNTDSGFISIPAAVIEPSPLQDDLNIMESYRQDCNRKYTKSAGRKAESSREQPAQPFNFQTAPSKQRQQVPSGASPGVHSNRSRTGKKCVVVSCENYGTPEYAFMCSKCFKDFTVQYHEQELEAKRRTEENNYHDLSIMTTLCKAGCGFNCSNETYPFCHECKPKFVSQGQQLQVGQALPPNSLVPEKCHGQGCTNCCSSATFPYCHSCYKTHATPRMPPTAPPPSGLETEEPQVSPRILSQDETAVVPLIHHPLFPQMGRQPNTAPPMEVQNQTGWLQKKCSTPSCQENAIRGNDGKCDQCYTQALYGSPTRNKCSVLNCPNSPVRDTKLCKKCFLISGSFSTERAISNTGPNPISNALPTEIGPPPLSGSLRMEPSQHDETSPTPILNPGEMALKMEQEGYIQNNFSKKLICSKPGCEGTRAENQSLCNICTLTRTQGNNLDDSVPFESCTPVAISEADMRKLNPLVVSSKQKIKCGSSSCNNMVYPPKVLCDECNAVLERNNAEKRKNANRNEVLRSGSMNLCKTEGCQYYGSFEHHGFCSSCYKSKATAPIKRHTAPLLPHPATQNAVSSGSSQRLTAPLVAGPRKGALCIEPNCTRFGDPKEGNRCNSHYLEAMAKMPPRTPKTEIHHLNYPSQEEQPHSGSNMTPSPRVNVQENEASAVIGHRANLDQYTACMSKVESSRKSTNLCKNNRKTGCTNYGNSRNKGYCNTCYPEVQRLESAHKHFLSGENQIG